jgi:hypothetical protein
MTLEVVWNGQLEAAAVRAQQQRLIEARPVERKRLAHGDFAARVVDTFAGQGWLTMRELADKLGDCLGNVNGGCYALCKRGVLERERPAKRGWRGPNPQRYRLRRTA